MTWTLLAATAGGALAAGLLWMISGLTARADPGPPAAARPPAPVVQMLGRVARDERRRRRLLIGAGVAVVVLVVSRWPVAALAAGAAVVALPRMLSVRPVAARLGRLDALEQWVRKLASLLGAGRGLEDALHASVRHAGDPIRPHVEQLVARLRAGLDAPAALYRFAEDLDDPVGDLVAGALLQASAVRGEGLQRLLGELAQLVAADVAGRREVEAARAPHRAAVKGIAAIFILFACALAVRPDYSAGYSTPLGQIVLAGVLGTCGAALWSLHRLAVQPPVARFLQPPSRPGPAPHADTAATPTTARDRRWRS